MPKNALAPEVTGVNRLIDSVVQRVPADWFPTAGRLFLETAQGKKSPITEQDFKPEEQAMLRRLIDTAGDKGYVTYDDYKTLQRQLESEGDKYAMALPSTLSITNPLGNLQTSLGRFRYAKDKHGRVQVTDAYDFNPLNSSTSQEVSGEAMAPFDFGYSFLRNYAGEKIPPGQGRNVNILLKTVK